MPAVINGIMALGRKAQALGKQGVGPKEAQANKREFTEEQLSAGKNVIGLQVTISAYIDTGLRVFFFIA